MRALKSEVVCSSVEKSASASVDKRRLVIFLDAMWRYYWIVGTLRREFPYY